MSQHRFDLVMFDLDGTLIDSAPDIHAAINELLATDGLGPVTLEQARTFIGNGVRKLIERAYAACARPLDLADMDAHVARMLPIYKRHLVNLTVPIPGAFEALAELAGQGRKLALVTNKPTPAIAEILAHFGIADRFVAVIGAEASYAPKPAPDMLDAAMKIASATRDQSIMVGDGAADIGGARAAGVTVIGLTGGYGPEVATGADVSIDAMSKLVATIEALEGSKINA